jgi:hypothetical protein
MKKTYARSINNQKGARGMFRIYATLPDHSWKQLNKHCVVQRTERIFRLPRERLADHSEGEKMIIQVKMMDVTHVEDRSSRLSSDSECER